jgi:metal-responsive CopG/Arc/MetJ family transcriptional regulator
MSTAKIAISIDNELLNKIDEFIKDDIFKNRSQAIQTAVKYIIKRMEHNRLARECAKLDPRLEQAMADEGLSQDFDEWPEY